MKAGFNMRPANNKNPRTGTGKEAGRTHETENRNVTIAIKPYVIADVAHIRGSRYNVGVGVARTRRIKNLTERAPFAVTTRRNLNLYWYPKRVANLVCVGEISFFGDVPCWIYRVPLKSIAGSFHYKILCSVMFSSGVIFVIKDTFFSWIFTINVTSIIYKNNFFNIISNTLFTTLLNFYSYTYTLRPHIYTVQIYEIYISNEFPKRRIKYRRIARNSVICEVDNYTARYNFALHSTNIYVQRTLLVRVIQWVRFIANSIVRATVIRVSFAVVVNCQQSVKEPKVLVCDG